MYNAESLKKLIEDAAYVAGSQRKLAEMLGMDPGNFMKIKKGERPASYQLRGRLRVIAGETPAYAFTAAVLEDLEGTESEDEKKAAAGFKTMLAAFPAEGWRRRRDSNPR